MRDNDPTIKELRAHVPLRAGVGFGRRPLFGVVVPVPSVAAALPGAPVVARRPVGIDFVSVVFPWCLA